MSNEEIWHLILALSGFAAFITWLVLWLDKKPMAGGSP